MSCYTCLTALGSVLNNWLLSSPGEVSPFPLTSKLLVQVLTGWFCSDELRESIRLMLRYGQVLFRPGWAVYEHEGGLLLRARISMGTAAQQQLLAEVIFSNLVAVGRSLYGAMLERAQGVEIHLSYSRPSHSVCHRRAFDTPVTFDCEHSQLFLPAQVLDIPVRTANRPQHVVFQQQCEEMLRGLNSVEKTTVTVRQLLIQSAGDCLDFARVAKLLRVSERTLRRRL